MQKRILLAKENGIRLKMVAYGIIVFACAVLLFTLVGIFQVNKKYQSLLSVTEQNINAVNAIDTLGNYSDYLTDQVREYVITMDFDYVLMYCGRIGPMTMALVFLGRGNKNERFRELPEGKVLIG